MSESINNNDETIVEQEAAKTEAAEVEATEAEAVEGEAAEVEATEAEAVEGEAAEVEAAEAPVDADAEAKRKKEKRTNVLLTILLVIAILVLAGLIVNIFFPATFNKIKTALFDSTPLTRGDTVMTVGDFEVGADEYVYYVESMAANNQSYAIASGEQFEELKQTAEQLFVSKYAYLQWAKDQNFTLSDEQIAELDAGLAENKATYGSEEEYITDLFDHYLTPESYRALYLDQTLLYAFRDSLYAMPEFTNVTEEEAYAFADENAIVRAKHILIQFPEEATEQDKAEKLALAQSLLERIKAGEDFDTLMNEYSEDPGKETSPGGYTLSKGSGYVAEFEDAALALELDAVSDIVETSYGYHIIKRVQIDPAELYEAVSADRISAKLDEYAANMPVSYGRGYDKIKSMADVVWNHTLDEQLKNAGITPAADTAAQPADEASGEAEQPAA